MTKYTSDIKLNIIQGYDPKVISQKEYAKQMGIKSTIPILVEII